jgi:hypothetical protein
MPPFPANLRALYIGADAPTLLDRLRLRSVVVHRTVEWSEARAELEPGGWDIVLLDVSRTPHLRATIERTIADRWPGLPVGTGISYSSRLLLSFASVWESGCL